MAATAAEELGSIPRGWVMRKTLRWLDTSWPRFGARPLQTASPRAPTEPGQQAPALALSRRTAHKSKTAIKLSATPLLV